MEAENSIPAKNSKTTILFLFAFAAVSFTYTNFMIDEALMGRFLVLNIFLLLFAFLIDTSTVRKIVLTPVGSFYFLYFLISLTSVSWAINASEGIFESSRIFFGLLVFILTVILHKQDEMFVGFLLKTSLFIFFGYLIIIVFEMISLDTWSFSRTEMYPVTGINGHKNELSGFLFLLLPFLLLSIHELKKPFRLFAFLAVIGSVVILIFLQSRSVWLGMVMTLVTSMLLLAYKKKNQMPKVRWRLPAFTILIIMLLTFLINWRTIVVKGNKAVFSSGAFEVRKILWEKTYEMFKDHPMLGVGAGNWQVNLPNYTLVGFSNANSDGVAIQQGMLVPDRPHNDLLWILAETGVIGFTCYATIFIALTWSSFSNLRRNESSPRAVVFFSFIVGYLTISLFSFPKERIEEIFLVNVIMGCLLSSVYFEQNDNSFEINRGFRYIRVIGVISLSVILVFGLIRARGEYYARKLIQARQIEDSDGVIGYANKSISRFYQLDNFGIPISWYKGSALISKGDVTGALSSFRNALSVAPYNVQVLNNLASAYEVSGDHQMAKSFYLEAIRISPGFEDPKLNLAAIYFNEGKYENALQWASEVTKISDRRQEYIRLIREKLKAK